MEIFNVRAMHCCHQEIRGHDKMRKARKFARIKCERKFAFYTSTQYWQQQLNDALSLHNGADCHHHGEPAAAAAATISNSCGRGTKQLAGAKFPYTNVQPGNAGR